MKSKKNKVETVEVLVRYMLSEKGTGYYAMADTMGHTKATRAAALRSIRNVAKQEIDYARN